MSDRKFNELLEEAGDFFEDFWEHLVSHAPKTDIKTKTAVINGIKVTVRPAYIFAERIDNLLKILFGLSISVSALTATFFGYTGLSDLLDALIFTPAGRILMFVIGSSYFTVALWKLLHLSGRR